jgi:hypothetical protein
MLSHQRAAVVLMNWMVALSDSAPCHNTINELATVVELHDNVTKEGVLG